MNKVYTRIEWKNYPSTDTAVNEANLNKMDFAIDEIDKRVVEQDIIKANVSSLNELITSWTIDKNTGVITIYKVSGEQIIFDLNIEKVPVGFSLTDEGILIMTTDDGTEFTANIGSMIPVLTFEDSEQIAVKVSGEGVNKTYSFSIKTGSITADKLQPNFLADVTLQANNAKTSADNAKTSEQNAKESEINAKNYADSVKPIASTVNGINPTLTNSTRGRIISMGVDGEKTQTLEKYLTALTETSSGVETNIIDCKPGDEVVLNCGVARVIGYHVYLEDNMVMYEEGSAIVQVHTFTADGKMKFVIKGGTLDDNITVTVNGSEYKNPSPTNEVPIYGVGESRNEFDINNITEGEAILEDGTISIHEQFVYSDLIVVSVGKYTLSGVGNTSTVYNKRIHGYDSNGNWVKQLGTISTTTAGQYYSLTFDISSDVSYIRLSLPKTDENVQLEKGTTATPYKAFGAHSLAVKTTGKNLCPTGSITATLRVYIPISNLTDGETYTLSCVINSTDTNTTTCNIYQGASGVGNAQRDKRVSVKFTKAEGISNLIVYASNNYANSEGDTITVSDIQIELGEATPYEPYTETTANIPLSAPMYEGDYIRYNMDGSGDLSRKMKAVNINITRTTTITNGNVGGVMDISDKINKQNNYAIATNATFTSMSTGESGTFYENPANLVFIGTAEDTLETLQEKYNGGVVVYELAEPTVTPLTAEQIAEFEKLRSFDGVTYVTCEGHTDIDYFIDSIGGKTVAMLAGMVKNSGGIYDLSDITPKDLEFNTAGEIVTTISGRVFKKANDGLAIGGYGIAIVNNGTYTMRILIAEKQEDCATDVYNQYTTFVYYRNGKTYYINIGGGMTNGTVGDGRGKKLNTLPNVLLSVKGATPTILELATLVLDYYYGYA